MKLFKTILGWFKPAKLRVTQSTYELVVNSIDFVKTSGKPINMMWEVQGFDETRCGTVCCLYGWLPGWNKNFKWDYFHCKVTPTYQGFVSSLSKDDANFLELNFLYNRGTVYLKNKKFQNKLNSIPKPDYTSIESVKERFHKIMKHVEIIPN